MSRRRDSRAFPLVWLFLLACWIRPSSADETPVAFLVCGDPQYVAEKAANPSKLDPLSEEAAVGFVRVVRSLPGSGIPERLGGGKVSRQIRGIIVTGDLIDSLDKRGGHYPAMQRLEWKRFLADFGLRGDDGRIPFPAYELHGNHDGPQGDTFVIRDIIARNKRRPGVRSISKNGLHYSWDWGPLHFVNLGMFAGEGEARREGHHYAPRASLKFLREDLAKNVGNSRRPVVLSHHLHLDAPEFDWPAEDLTAYWKIVEKHNVVAIFNGHTHGSPPRRRPWNGKAVGPKVSGVDSFDPDDAAAAKLHKGEPVGLRHGFLYVELRPLQGDGSGVFVVRSLSTRDNWKTWEWGERWEKSVELGRVTR